MHRQRDLYEIKNTSLLILRTFEIPVVSYSRYFQVRKSPEFGQSRGETPVTEDREASNTSES